MIGPTIIWKNRKYTGLYGSGLGIVADYQETFVCILEFGVGIIMVADTMYLSCSCTYYTILYHAVRALAF
jgi:hypothetical protein